MQMTGLQAHKKAGPGVLKALPTDVNPKMKEQLLSAIADGGSPSPSSEANRRSSSSGAAAAAPRKQKNQSAPALPPLPPGLLTSAQPHMHDLLLCALGARCTTS